MSLKAIPAALCLCLLLTALPVRAEEYQLTTLEYPPYEFQHGLEVRGIAVEIVREAFRRMGHTVKITLLPWPRALERVREGEADGIFTAFRTRERLEFLDYCEEVLMPQTTSLFVRANSPIEFNGNLADLARYRFGMVRGVSYGEDFDKATSDGTLKNMDQSTTGQQNMSKLLAGRFDILVSNRYGAWDILRIMEKQTQVRELEPSIEDVPSYLAFSKVRNLKALACRFDETLRQMKQDGAYQQFIDEYFQKQ
ncbi:substrate-binding periplasmic protein [Salidesulfovibrio onnuriiensis]|uniref:substrate-binding periplasmic protein n=1 Tax=Salidesulfovibrio onnuriiensis TaxID=2583823 RepID=UPI0011CBA1FC|nr:transporter substrate-binding domain-containing protein [Salidesulfovibrio onnuriiensis]